MLDSRSHIGQTLPENRFCGVILWRRHVNFFPNSLDILRFSSVFFIYIIFILFWYVLVSNVARKFAYSMFYLQDASIYLSSPSACCSDPLLWSILQYIQSLFFVLLPGTVVLNPVSYLTT